MTGAACEVTTLRRDRNVHIIILLLLLLCYYYTVSGSTNRAYRMLHTSMINITFGEERRDFVIRQQKQSSSTGVTPQRRLVIENRALTTVANGNGKQQLPQQPMYKLLQHPRHSEFSSAGHQGAARSSQANCPAQETAVSPQKTCLFDAYE